MPAMTRYRERFLESIHARIREHHKVVQRSRASGNPASMAPELAEARCRLAECLGLLEDLEGPGAVWSSLDGDEGPEAVSEA